MNHTGKESSESRGTEDGFAGASFFYSNLRIQENLTTIRYGIETRRGLILVIGDSGAGKTTLLRTALSELPEHIDCAVIPRESHGFPDVLRLLLRRLDKAGETDPQTEGPSAESNEAAAVRRCQALLRGRLQRSELVALVIDDAHLLPERTLRNLMHNFLGGSAEAPDGALLQIILAGNASLKSKLNQAALIPLRRRRPVVCEVQAFNSQEVAAYIQQGLRAAHRPEHLFDERAIKRVALMTRGSPRSVSELCSRALQSAGEGCVTAELIDATARKLEIPGKDRQRSAAPSGRNFGIFSEEEADAEHPEFAIGRPSLADEPAFFESRRDRPRFDWLPRGERVGSWLRGLTFVTLAIAAAALIPAEPVIKVLAEWRTRLSEFATPGENSAPRETALSPDRAPAMPDPPVRSAEPEPPSPIAKAERPAGVRQAAPMGKSAAAPQRRDAQDALGRGAPSALESRGSPRPAEKPTSARQREIQLEVAKAIASRAIIGVEVSVVQGTAILEGHVASERQRRAAERAALSVSGVERVRNRIAITYG
jgi:type II secretory pathway predicted ATPase ExeA